MNYEGILEFKGTWRNYQARVLEHADRYMADGKIHIVAAPGSGKTTLGIELIRRMNGKALILAPSITIREQWIARIEEEGTVKDTVSGGMGGIQHFVVEGMPVPELRRKKLLLNKRKAMLIEKENELLELMNQAEEYINSIEKSELRMMFRFYYIDGMTWLQVAHRMNQLHPKRRVAYTEDSCRMRNTRFFQEN